MKHLNIPNYPFSLTREQQFAIYHRLKEIIISMEADDISKDGFCNMLTYVGVGIYISHLPELIKYKPESSRYGEYWFQWNDTKSRLDIINKILETENK